MKVTKEADTKPGYCQCGRLLHYTNRSSRQMVDKIVGLAKDEFVTVAIGGNKYRVQRHFIALHGFNAKIAEQYGFEKVQ